MLPSFIRNAGEIIERLLVLKTTMRWTIAHTSLEEQERKHPIELSLWAINTLLLIENLGVPVSYAGRVLALNQRLWVWVPSYKSGLRVISNGACSLLRLNLPRLCLYLKLPLRKAKEVAPRQLTTYAFYLISGMFYLAHPRVHSIEKEASIKMLLGEAEVIRTATLLRDEMKVSGTQQVANSVQYKGHFSDNSHKTFKIKGGCLYTVLHWTVINGDNDILN